MTGKKKPEVSTSNGAMCDDRTNEFMALAASVPPQQGGPALSASAPASVASLHEFHAASADIARGIHVTSQQLSQLTKLVQRRGLFNDPADDINTLVHSIKEGIQGLNGQLDSTQAYVEHQRRKLGQQPANHSAHVVGQLKTELMETTKAFKDVLQQRSLNLKAQEDRKDMFFHKPSAVASGKPAVYKPVSSPPVFKPPIANGGASSGAMNGNAAGAGDATAGNGRYPQGLLPRPGQVTSLPDSEQDAETSSAMVPLIPAQAQMRLIASHSYLETRSTAMQEVETHIVELSTIFNRLATMLQSQRELVESVHDNIDDAADNVERGQLALINTLRSVSSNRVLAAKITAILFIFIVLFVLLFL